MSKQISQLRLFGAVVDGIEKAQLFYEEVSGDSWLWEAPESLLVVFVAQAINSIKGAKYCTLESNVHQTLGDAQASTVGAPPKKLRHKGRFDLVLWWANGAPRAAIEFKNQVYSYSQIRKDVDRIESVIKRNLKDSSFQFGAVAFYTSCIESSRSSAPDKLAARIQHLYEQTKDHVPESTKVSLHHGEIHSLEDSAWVSVCIALKC